MPYQERLAVVGVEEYRSGEWIFPVNLQLGCHGRGEIIVL